MVRIRSTTVRNGSRGVRKGSSINCMLMRSPGPWPSVPDAILYNPDNFSDQGIISGDLPLSAESRRPYGPTDANHAYFNWSSSAPAAPPSPNSDWKPCWVTRIPIPCMSVQHSKYVLTATSHNASKSHIGIEKRHPTPSLPESSKQSRHPSKATSNPLAPAKTGGSSSAWDYRPCSSGPRSTSADSAPIVPCSPS